MFFNFKKKKKNKEGEAADSGNADTSVDVVVDEDTEDTEAAGADAKSPIGIDLKTTLIMSIVGLTSVVGAFVFTLRMSPTIDRSGLEIIEEANEDADVSTQDETKTKDEKKGKSDKADSTTAEKGDISDIVNDEDVDAESYNESGKILVPLQSIVANLGGVESRRYLRVLINLEVDSTEARDLVNAKMVKIRDNLISFFSDKSASDIESEGSLIKLRLEIKSSLNKLIGPDKIIKQVYFSDFIVQ